MSSYIVDFFFHPIPFIVYYYSPTLAQFQIVVQDQEHGVF